MVDLRALLVQLTTICYTTCSNVQQRQEYKYRVDSNHGSCARLRFIVVVV